MNKVIWSAIGLCAALAAAVLYLLAPVHLEWKPVVDSLVSTFEVLVLLAAVIVACIAMLSTVYGPSLFSWRASTGTPFDDANIYMAGKGGSGSKKGSGKTGGAGKGGKKCVSPSGSMRLST